MSGKRDNKKKPSAEETDEDETSLIADFADFDEMFGKKKKKPQRLTKEEIEDMKTNKEDFSYLMQLPSWQLYNWMPLYAGNSFKVSKDSFDKNELEEYNKIVEKINSAAEQYDDFKITI